MEIFTAKYAGFCFGVKRAVEMAIAAAENKETRPIYTMGPLIHNAQVVGLLKTKGIGWVNDICDLKGQKGTIIIRSHGIAPLVIKELSGMGWHIIDATCPFVKNAQYYSSLLFKEGYQLIIYGDAGHPEVKGILGHIDGQAFVADKTKQLADFKLEQKVALIAQTTKSITGFKEFMGELVTKVKELRIFNTICTTTAKRQEEVFDMAAYIDLFLVVGGKNSSNTKNLACTCKRIGKPTYHIENKSEINPNWFVGIESVGIVAGASTPNWIIKEVEELMCEMADEKKKEMEQTEEKQEPGKDIQCDGQEELKEEKPDQDVQTEGDETSSENIGAKEECQDEPEEEKEPVKDEESLEEEDVPAGTVNEEEKEEALETTAEEEMSTKPEPHPMEGEDALQYSQNLKSLRKGQIIKGKVIEIKEDGVFVDIGYKTEGFVPKRELEQRQVDDPASCVESGQEIFVSFLGMDDEGMARLSKRKADVEKAWEHVINAQANGETITGMVTKVVKGGLVVDIGLRGFIPASHVAIEYVEDLEQFVGQELEMRVLEVEKKNNNVVLSRKKILEERQEKLKEETLNTIQENDIINGKVTKIVDFGAFVDIGGVEGLLHISEMSWGRIDHPSQVVEEGREIDVKVLSIDRETERISLGLKQILPDPWDTFVNKYHVGDVVNGRITKTVSFGAFMEIEEGIEGLIHISQLARRHVETPDEVVKAGNEVTAKIININEAERKVGLSLKELETEKQRKDIQQHEAQKDEGRITIGDHLNSEQLGLIGQKKDEKEE